MSKKASPKPKGAPFRALIRVSVVLLCILLVGVIAVIGINVYVYASTDGFVYHSVSELESRDDIECIVVLGAGLKPDGTPSNMLEDRIKVGVELMEKMGTEYILMTGDGSDRYYNEPAAMKKYAESLGVDSDKILLDEMGLSTYDSIKRIKEGYGFKSVAIVTQSFHVNRALYIAKDCGIAAFGVSADLRGYETQTSCEIRELFARIKDFFVCI